jgi:hypothetical protein
VTNSNHGLVTGGAAQRWGDILSASVGLSSIATLVDAG